MLFHIYLSPGKGVRTDPSTYVGNINFFDAEFHDHGNGAMGDVIGENFQSFDVTDILRRFARDGVSDARNALVPSPSRPQDGLPAGSR